MLNVVIGYVAKQRSISFVSLLVVVMLLLGFTSPLGAAPKLDKIKKNKIKVKKNKLVKSVVQLDETQLQPCLPNTERGRKGQWCEAYNNPVVAIHMSVLPDGRVISWGSGGLNGDSNKTAVAVWTPGNPVSQRFDYLNGNLFCSGHSFLPDGRLLVSGGIDNGAYAVGIKTAAIFDYTTNQWNQLPVDMNAGRWYPTSLTLGNGNTLVWAGTIGAGAPNNTPQILEKQFDGTFAWHSLSINNPEGYDNIYSWLHLLSSGKVFVAHGGVKKSYLVSLGDRFQRPSMYEYPIIKPYTTEDWTLTDPHDSGSSVVIDKDEILVVGGGSLPKQTAEYINMNDPNPKWTRVGRLGTGRRQMDTTLLPDGKVLVTGGNKGDGYNNTCSQNFVKVAEMWNPSARGVDSDVNTPSDSVWTQLASATQPRIYHSSAVLLPDGRVLTGGTTREPNPQGLVSFPGGAPCQNETLDVRKMEVFSPPYLFNLDGTDAARPQISNAPSQVSYGQTIQFTVTGAGMNSKVNLIRLPSVTHSFNQNQGFNKLTPTVNGQNFSVTIPANRNECPPGHYMMFVINSDGVPSVAKIIQVL